MARGEVEVVPWWVYAIAVAVGLCVVVLLALLTGDL